ncbi:hypothetical protein GV792_28880, partial [Nocardia cyriacigeorgica]|nr:hypothetical protein [Nocardia cyriacigeorgica]
FHGDGRAAEPDLDRGGGGETLTRRDVAAAEVERIGARLAELSGK